jgi:hypothetical protein
MGAWLFVFVVARTKATTAITTAKMAIFLFIDKSLMLPAFKTTFHLMLPLLGFIN